MDKCIQCGLCVKVCSRGMIQLKDGRPEISLNRCMNCGHCVAVCPTGCLEHPLSIRQETIKPILNYEEALKFLRTTRSHRNFTTEKVPRQLMEQLVEAGRYPQTGGNSQGIQYLVVNGHKSVQKILEVFLETACRAGETEETLAWVAERAKRVMETKQDTVLHDCAALVLALADRSNPLGRESAQFSLTYLALVAPTLKLGTCWAGIFERIACSEVYGLPIRKFLNIRDDLRICGAMMVGMPAVSFQRMVMRDPLRIEFLELD